MGSSFDASQLALAATEIERQVKGTPDASEIQRALDSCIRSRQAGRVPLAYLIGAVRDQIAARPTAVRATPASHQLADDGGRILSGEEAAARARAVLAKLRGAGGQLSARMSEIISEAGEASGSNGRAG